MAANARSDIPCGALGRASGSGGKRLNTSRRTRLRAAGWKVGNAAELLGLSRDEAALVEMKFRLGAALRRYRLRREISQQALAARVGSSQSRIAKLEAGASGITLDLLVRALFATGASPQDIAREIGSSRKPAA